MANPISRYTCAGAVLICLLLSSTVLLAKPKEPAQREFNKITQADQTLVSYVWKDSRDLEHYVKASLNTAEILAASRVQQQFKPRHLASYIQQAIRRAEGNLPPGVKLRLVNSGYSYSVNIDGDDAEDIAQAKSELSQVIQQAEYDYLHARHLAKFQDGYGTNGVVPDHIYYARTSLPPLAPLINGFYKQINQLAPHIAIDRITSFVQAIPLTPLDRLNNSFIPPSSVVFNNKGDSDSKATLAVSLIRGVYPRRRLAMVYLKEHTFLAVQFGYDVPGDWFNHKDERWLPMEVAGPTVLVIGKMSEQTKREMAAKAYRLVPIP